MPSRRTTSIIWLITLLVAFAGLFVTLALNPTNEGILLGILVALGIVVLGLVWTVAYDRMKKHRGAT